ncbi:NUDIX hydrolase [Nocardiopsis eucommiae]|uniref:NUDIX hydrolase n=1 Tax=Nocardiopsis eucommiae TaxID=2831970 RepID=A0A975LCV4_9ACTN|nr:NUDIX hydrolase [Nocardiopsis eucommiae]
MSYSWHEAAEPPPFMPIRQVYGYLFDSRGRVVVLYDEDLAGWNLPGGSPDEGDAGDRNVTLAREAAEEVQVSITNPTYLGYQRVDSAERAPYAQLRMAARVEHLGSRAPDPDGARVHPRRLCPFPEAVELLGWGPSAERQFACAAATARGWGLPVGSAQPIHIS